MLLQARRHRFLLSIIDQLPGTSRYAEAIADDDEAAEVFLELGGDEPSKPRIRLSEWSPVLAELRHINERLVAIAHATAASAGARTPPKFQDLPRPVVAADRVRRRRALAQHRRLVAQLIRDDPEED